MGLGFAGPGGRGDSAGGSGRADGVAVSRGPARGDRVAVVHDACPVLHASGGTDRAREPGRPRLLVIEMLAIAGQQHAQEHAPRRVLGPQRLIQPGKVEGFGVGLALLEPISDLWR